MCVILYTHTHIYNYDCISTADLLQEESTILGQDINLGPCVGKKKVLRRRRNISDRPQSVKHPSETRVQSTHGSGSPAKSHTQKAQGKDCVCMCMCVCVCVSSYRDNKTA